MKYIRVVLFLVLFVISCKEVSKSPVVEISPQLCFPESVELKRYDYKLPFNGIESEYKILVSYDSLMCGSCSVNRLSMWNEMLKYAEDHSDLLSVIILFSPKESEKKKVSVMLDTDPVSYPTYFDVDNDFYKLNSLPRGIFTCLLDSNNNVLFVGHASDNELLNNYKNLLNLD